MADVLTHQIRRLRFDHCEMSQQQLAQRAGVTRQTIIALEANNYSRSLLLAMRIARIFNTSVEAVFQYTLDVPEESQSGGSSRLEGIRRLDN